MTSSVVWIIVIVKCALFTGVFLQSDCSIHRSCDACIASDVQCYWCNSNVSYYDVIVYDVIVYDVIVYDVS